MKTPHFTSPDHRQIAFVKDLKYSTLFPTMSRSKVIISQTVDNGVRQEGPSSDPNDEDGDE